MSRFFAATCQYRRSRYGLGRVLFIVALLFNSIVVAQDSESEIETGSYKINAGDVLSLQVWNEP
jgi:protein involved in polysaccharide export with SLBB domain